MLTPDQWLILVAVAVIPSIAGVVFLWLGGALDNHLERRRARAHRSLLDEALAAMPAEDRDAFAESSPPRPETRSRLSELYL